MDEQRLLKLEASLEEQHRCLEELRTTQQKIADALLGSLEEKSIGLIGEMRNIQTNMGALPCVVNKAILNKHEADLAELKQWRENVMKIVTGIAFAIPLVFEGVKFLLSLAWEWIKVGR